MTVFSKDRDLLRHEAAVFGDLHFGWQVLCAGDGGVLSGTAFVKAGEDFGAAGVQAGGVIYLRADDGSIDGVYEIVSVESAEQLTVSVLRGDEAAEAIAPPGGEGLHYRVSTFEPQARQVGLELAEYVGIRPGRGEGAYGVEDVVDTAALRRASVFGVLAAVYVTLADGRREADGLLRKWEHYRRLYEEARQRCCVGIDADGDGVIEKRMAGGSVRLVRE